MDHRFGCTPSVGQKRFLHLLCAAWLAVLFACGSSHAFSPQDILFSKQNDPFVVYNYVLPDLMRFAAFAPDDPPETKILKTIRHVNFFTTINRYEYRVGKGFLPYSVAWWDHLSYWLASGHILCSEQAGLAAMMLLPWFPDQAFRDVYAHTFFEVELNDRWIIVDPMFDSRLRNKDGHLASFDDIRAYLEGDSQSLQLPNPVFPRLAGYLDRFRPEQAAQNTNQRQAYGKHTQSSWPGNPNADFTVQDQSTEEILEELANSGQCRQTDPVCMEYLRFVRNQIHKAVLTSPDPQKTLYAFQDRFLGAIARTHMGREELDNRYYARSYMLLGRLKLAEKHLQHIKKKKEQDYYFLSLIHFLRRDKDAFNALAKNCQDNPYYCYLYWRLNGAYLNTGDPKTFAEFWSKAYGLDLQNRDGLFKLEFIE